MKRPQFRLRIRTLLGIVALFALAFVGVRVYRDGLEAHWLVLKLSYGNVGARRSAARDAWDSERSSWALDFFNSVGAASADASTAESERGRRQRRAELLLPSLITAMSDPDAECRGNAVRSLGDLAAFHASNSEKGIALRHILAAARDHDDSVRTSAVYALGSLAGQDTTFVMNAIRSALADPSVRVRREATRQLGMLGATWPETRPDVASILTLLLASREDSRVRVQAAWALSFVGRDRFRRPRAADPDVALAVVAALRDPDVDVRRAAASILGVTTFDAQGRTISAWEQRKAVILPALKAAICDDDKAVREESSLALFAFGNRDEKVIELIEQAARDPERSWKSHFDAALTEWKAERNMKEPSESAAPRDGVRH